jgi:hypothetical protein
MSVAQLMPLLRAPLLPHHLDGFITLGRKCPNLMWSEKKAIWLHFGAIEPHPTDVWF